MSLTVARTVELNLCVSCEVCVAACPFGAIETHMVAGSLVPRIDAEKCTDCGRCARVCPGLDMPGPERGFSAADVAEWALGNASACYTAYAADAAVRANGISGGAVTALLEGLLAEGDIDVAFVLGPAGPAEQPARHVAATDSAALRAAAGSKYLPASVLEAGRYLTTTESPRVAIVATPCQMLGLTKLMEQKKVDRSGVLLLGLVCDGTMNYNVVRWFEDEFAKPGEKLATLKFRTKEKSGWPGDSRVLFDSGRELDVPRSVRTGLKEYFALRRCQCCADKLNLPADLVFGDCYVPGKGDKLGTSTVLVRTPAGAEALERHADRLRLESADLAGAAASQHVGRKERNNRFAAAYASESGLVRAPLLLPELAERTAAEMRAAFAAAALGASYDRAGIARAVAGKRRRARWARIRSRAALVLVLAGTLVRAAFVRRSSARPVGESGTVLLFGATFDNTGAHAMILTSIEEVARRAPGLAVVALSASEARRRPDARYRMAFAPWSTGVKVRLLSPRLGRVAFPDVAEEAVAAAREVVSSAQLALEISGFRLGSVWGLANSLDYLLNLLIMRVHRVRTVVMPQSLGPFEYRTWQRIALYPFMKFGLGWAQAVFARERDGESWAKRYVPATTHLHADMVLSHGPLDPALIYREGEGPIPAQVGRPAAAIVPSLRVLERVGDSLTGVYTRIVERLLASGRRVYLVTHSAEDAPASERIKAAFADNDHVQVIDRHLDPVEVEELMAELDLVVASRYHSVVHAYKQGVPAVVIGWAVKYAELAELFGQSRYVFDVRQGVPAEELLAALDTLLLERDADSARIREGLAALTVDDVFDGAFGR